MNELSSDDRAVDGLQATLKAILRRGDAPAVERTVREFTHNVQPVMRPEARISYPLRDGPRPYNGLGAHARACEGAARGVGAPASDRVGVRGGAPSS